MFLQILTMCSTLFESLDYSEMSDLRRLLTRCACAEYLDPLSREGFSVAKLAQLKDSEKVLLSAIISDAIDRRKILSAAQSKARLVLHV